MIKISNLKKVYDGGFEALKSINLEIKKGEIFALLGPNGAGKTTLINSVCGIVTPSSGEVFIDGNNTKNEFKKARSLIGLVPQELTKDAFETVWNTVNFSRGLFGKPKNHKLIEEILKDLSLWDKKDNRLMSLSGGMKRRVLIAKALSHEPRVLFLDEPTAGVDVSLRKSMWNLVRKLKKSGVTIILTTHYIEEAEEMADRIAVINKGQIILTEQKDTLMKKLGRKELIFTLKENISELPAELKNKSLKLINEGQKIVYTYDSQKIAGSIEKLVNEVHAAGIKYTDLNTKQSSLEDIFVNLVSEA